MPKMSDTTRAALAVANVSPGVAKEIGDSYDRMKTRASTPLALANVATNGWGSSPGVALDAGSLDCHGGITITAGSGPSANPTITITFPDGAYPQAPQAVASLDPGTAADSALPVAVTCTTTTMKFTLGGTPTNTRTYHIPWHLFEA